MFKLLKLWNLKHLEKQFHQAIPNPNLEQTLALNKLQNEINKLQNKEPNLITINVEKLAELITIGATNSLKNFIG